MEFKLCTMNTENLFARYRFKKNFEPPEEGFTINDTQFEIFDEPEKKVTAEAIRAVDADILCLQEVENLPTLERFASRYLGKLKYKHRILIDSHDPRMIDVAVLSRFPIVGVRTQRDRRTRDNKAYLYSRDNLEVTVELAPGQEFVVYVNHFKSMMEGREATAPRRREQAEDVAQILRARWGERLRGNFAVVGDFNDYLDDASALNALVKKPLVNVVARLPSDEQWTHYWAKGKEYRQLDFILLPEDLDRAQDRPVPVIERRGQPWRAEKYTGPRFDDVGENEPKASDHCPVCVALDSAKLV